MYILKHYCIFCVGFIDLCFAGVPPAPPTATKKQINIYLLKGFCLKKNQGTGSIHKKFFYLSADNENFFVNLHPCFAPLTFLHFRCAIALPPTGKQVFDQFPVAVTFILQRKTL